MVKFHTIECRCRDVSCMRKPLLDGRCGRLENRRSEFEDLRINNYERLSAEFHWSTFWRLFYWKLLIVPTMLGVIIYNCRSFIRLGTDGGTLWLLSYTVLFVSALDHGDDGWLCWHLNRQIARPRSSSYLNNFPLMKTIQPINYYQWACFHGTLCCYLTLKCNLVSF